MTAQHFCCCQESAELFARHDQLEEHVNVVVVGRAVRRC